MPSSLDLRGLLRHRVTFEIGATPAESRFVFHTPDGEERATANEAIGALSQGVRVMYADPTARTWANPAILALRLMARGGLGSPSDGENHQLQHAAQSIATVDGKSGLAQVQQFLAALAVDAPAAASTPQRSSYEPSTPAAEPYKPVTYSFTFVVTFLSEPTDTEAAVVRVRVRPSRGATFEATDLIDNDEHPRIGAREPLTTMLQRLEDRWAPSARLLQAHARGATTVSTAELAQLGSGHLTTLLMACRVDVSWPPELVRELDTSVVVQRDERLPADRPTSFTQAQLFRFDWQIAIGDTQLTAAEVEELAASHHGFLRIRDQWVFVEKSRIERALHRTSGQISAIEALRAAVTGELQIDGETTAVDTVGWLDEVRQRLAASDRDIVPAEQPAGLDGHLREYQLQGLRWMAQLTDLGLGGILADDMGLGKTVMLIALHLNRHDLHRARTGEQAPPTLVVCPASVLGNWEREIKRFAPGVPVHRYHGPRRWVGDATEGFVVTTYATMRADSDLLAKHDPGWGLVVADEAQNVKNPRSRAAQALRDIPSDARVAMTGTPVENNLSELWAILDWTTPGLLGTHDQFRSEWSRRIESGRDDDAAGGLSALIRPFLLRRRKSDPGIAPELPPKIETDHTTNLTREQVGLYEAVVRQTMAQIEQAAGIQRRGLVVKLLTQLKQICNHPAHFLRETEGRLGGRSGKLGVFDDLVEEIVAEESGVLVFTQYAQMGRLLTRHLADKRIEHQFLHGGTGVPTRENMVRRFQDGEVPVFVLSLKAAGTGLNLTRADHVIHYDRWWNPAVEDQATDRAHRIGQTRSVQVHRLISEGTIEESIAELIASKRSLADAVVNGGEGALTELSDAELARLVALRH
jgi:superfamily II DNA or RNA helicase